MEMGGNVREQVIIPHTTVASNTFKIIWGDGSVAADGTQNVSTWPVPIVDGTGSYSVITWMAGERGGSWTDAALLIQTSDRTYTGVATTITRNAYTGGRGAR